jgi:hypothetical protein
MQSAANQAFGQDPVFVSISFVLTSGELPDTQVTKLLGGLATQQLSRSDRRAISWITLWFDLASPTIPCTKFTSVMLWDYAMPAPVVWEGKSIFNFRTLKL